MTVFLTTHYMEEAASADYVVVIDEGSVVAKGTPTELKNRYTTDTLRFIPIAKHEIGVNQFIFQEWFLLFGFFSN
jgi:ABC-type multidrug transport system ATPase subunit